MKYLIIINLLVFPFILFAQPEVKYFYDNVGNRVQRKMIVNLDDGGEKQLFKDQTQRGEEDTSSFLAEKIEIFPNPTQDRLQIVFSESMPGAKLELFDTQGQRIFSEPTSTETISIDLSTYPSGTYHLSIFYQNKSQTWQVIKLE